MIVFIHDNFRHDLTHLNITFSETNQWMKDDISTEISIPFEIDYDSEFTKKIGFQKHYNASQNQTSFSGILDKDGIISEAVLNIQSIKGNKISAQIIAGINNFASFDNKLAELLLEIKTGIDIIADANAVITQVYPDTNYNFPMVHTDKYDPESNEWTGFGKIINNYAGGNFLANELDEIDNIDYIRNIMQPMPYLLHILKKGVEAVGKILTGDVLEDYDLQRALVFRDGDYYDRGTKEEVPLTYLNTEYDSLPFVVNSFQYVQFLKEITVTKKGDYSIFGTVNSLIYTARKNPASLHNRKRVSAVTIILEKISGGITTPINSVYHTKESDGQQNLQIDISSDSFDLPVSFNVGDILRIVKIEPIRTINPLPTPDYPEAISLKLIPVRYRNSDGSPIISVFNKTEIDLTKVVPDMTFRELVTIVKNWFNYEFIPDGDFITMNKIDGKLDRTKAIDLSDFDIDEPERQFSEDIEYELAFADGKSNDDYQYDSILVTKAGVSTNNYYTKTATKTIKIDGLPLPVIGRNGVTTAYSFQEETSKLRLVFMKPMQTDQTPVAFENRAVFIPNIYNHRYINWLNFRINSVAFNWDFIISVEKFKEITIQSIIYSYQNNHVFTDLEKERLNSMYWRVTAKTESLL